MAEAKKASTRKAQARSAQTPEDFVGSLGTVESKVPGRIRVRLAPEFQTPEAMAQIQAKLSAHENAGTVSVNERTGSVTVTHDAEKDGHTLLSEALKGAEFLAETALDLPEDDEEEGGGDRFSKLDQQLADIAYRAEKVVYQKTGLRFRGQILAGSIAGVGVAQMVVFGISLEMLPGPLLLWIAWDIYHRVANEPAFPDRDAEAAPAEETDAQGEPSFAPAT